MVEANTSQSQAACLQHADIVHVRNHFGYEGNDLVLEENCSAKKRVPGLCDSDIHHKSNIDQKMMRLTDSWANAGYLTEH